MSNAKNETIKLTSRGKLTMWAAGIITVGTLGYLGVNHLESSTDEKPLEYQRGIATKVIDAGKVPAGYGMETVGDGETPITIAQKLHAKDVHKVSDEIQAQVGDEAGNIHPGDKILLQTAELPGAYVQKTTIPSGQLEYGSPVMMEMPYLYPYKPDIK